MLIMLTHDKPLLSGQPTLSGHLLVSEGGHLIEVYLYFLGSQMSLRICDKFAAVKTATKVN